MNKWKKKMIPNRSTLVVIMGIKMTTTMMMLNMRDEEPTKSNRIMITKMMMIVTIKIRLIKNMKLLNKNSMKQAEVNVDILKCLISQGRLTISSLRIFSKEKRII